MKHVVSRNRCLEALVENEKIVRNGSLDTQKGRDAFDDNQRIVTEHRYSFEEKV